MDKRDKVLLQKILSEANVIVELIEGFDCDSFVNDEKYMEDIWETVNVDLPVMSNNIKIILEDAV